RGGELPARNQVVVAPKPDKRIRASRDEADVNRLTGGVDRHVHGPLLRVSLRAAVEGAAEAHGERIRRLLGGCSADLDVERAHEPAASGAAVSRESAVDDPLGVPAAARSLVRKEDY